MSPSAQRKLGVFGHSPLKGTRLFHKFGLNIAPKVFRRVLKPTIKHLRSQGIELLTYMDDLLICSATFEERRAHTCIVAHTLHHDLLINWGRSELTPEHKIGSWGSRWTHGH